MDVFFVISGFLISGIIFRGLAAGSFSYRTFYAKRIRRIIPNLVLLFLFVAALGWLFLLPGELENLGRHIASSAGFVQNFRLLHEIGYFTEDALRKPLLHLWSLAIEEQFYILFPILCAVLWRFWKSRFLMVTAVVMITVCSLEACLLLPDRNFTFYFPLTRFWELGAGILLAALETFGLFDFRRVVKPLRSAASVLGLLLIAGAMAAYRTKYGQHPGFFTVLPVLGSVLLIAAQPDALVNRTLLSWRPMTFVGLISYSLYLWHWPLLAFLFICEPHAPKAVIGLTLALSFVLATGVYFLVEQPVRRCRRHSRLIVALLIVLLIGCFAGGRILVRHHGYVHRDRVFMTAQTVRAVGEWDPFNQASSLQYEGVRIATPTPEVFPEIIFAGDSHNVQYYARAEALAQRTRKTVGFIGRTGCFILGRDSCKEEAKALFSLAQDPRVKTMVIGNMWGSRGDQTAAIAEFRQVAAARQDLKIYVLLDYPWTPAEANGQQGEFDPLRHVSRWKGLSNYVVSYPKDDAWARGNAMVEKAFAGAATFIRPETFVCPEKRCNLLHWYRDDDHLQPMRLKAEGVWLDPIFE